MSKPLRCCSCNKVIAEEISIQAGVVKITCKCGTVNEVKAEPKQSVPYGERQQYEVKTADGYVGRMDEDRLHQMNTGMVNGKKVFVGPKEGDYWGGTPLNTSKNAKG
jgi:phage FluMu protein Com